MMKELPKDRIIGIAGTLLFHALLFLLLWFLVMEKPPQQPEAGISVVMGEEFAMTEVEVDENGKMNLNLEQVGGALLVISQFTLYADTSSRRPGFSGAAKPDKAIPLYERFLTKCREKGFHVEHGQFGADMKVASVNDGPVTILYDM